VVETRVVGVWPETEGSATLRVLGFLGGGFAGQVYKVSLEALSLKTVGDIRGVGIGRTYALKLLVPPSRLRLWFRDAVYWLGYQGPFSAQIHYAAARAGVYWQKLVRRAAELEFGRPDAVADVYATVYDSRLQAYGELIEFVDGRMWRLEPDLAPALRRNWRTVQPRDTHSPEFVAKRQFMARLVDLLHRMGGVEFARQYEWTTLKSQPNVVKRLASGPDPEAGLCAIDFRAGLALLPWLPMSPGDFRLIAAGLRRGAWVQFDRLDVSRLRAFVAGHAAEFSEYTVMIDRLVEYDRVYRQSLPDLTFHGAAVFTDPTLSRQVREGLIAGYLAHRLVDSRFSRVLSRDVRQFAGFYLLGALPFFGPFIRRVWGNADYRAHLGRMVHEWTYLQECLRADVARHVAEWHRDGRVNERMARFLAGCSPVYWVQRLTVGWLPPVLHRAVVDPGHAWASVCRQVRFVLDFYRDAAFRRDWLSRIVEEGFEDGILDAREREEIQARIGDPFIAKYLRALAVHLCTLPLSEIVYTLTGLMAGAWVLAHGQGWEAAVIRFAWAFGLLQLSPITPGSLVRGFYVIGLMVRERNFRDYMVAAPLAFLKGLGYLAFPIQMVTAYPALSRLMGSRWATDAVHVVPVFGERGALLEHAVFDLCFNGTRRFATWSRQRIRMILDVWLFCGLILLLVAFAGFGVSWSGKTGINLILGVTAVFVLPRLVFLPLMVRRK
jgi:hypothetical protein